LPAFLSKVLNEEAQSHYFAVLNLGENGFNSVLESKYLQKALTALAPSPDVVIFYDGANNCFQYAEYRQPVDHIGYRRLRAFIESYRQSWLGLFKPINAAIHASYTNEFIDRIRMFHDPVKPDSPALRQMVELTVRRYDHVAKVVNAYGAKFVLIWQPMLWVEDCDASRSVKSGERSKFVDKDRFPDLEASVRVAYKALEDALQDRPYFVSFRDVLCSRTVPLFWPDGIHLRNEGNEIVAREMGRFLMHRFPKEFSTEPSDGSVAEK
jgi:lysophospholipase L1-like esterase